MSTSSSSSEPEVPLLPRPHWQKARPISWRHPRKFAFKQLAILATLVILLVLVQNVSILAAFPPPEPTSSSTRVSSAIPTATSTSSPTATATPTSIPMPSPITTSWLTATLTATSTTTAQPAINHVVIISIDGLRPDALQLAEAPTVHSLISHGTYHPSAQTVTTSETLPSHASMLSGMTPEKHGILWGAPYIGWPGMNGPTLFNVTHDAGLSTAMIFGKQKMNYLVLAGSVDQVIGADMHDTEIKNQALAIIQAGLPNVLFIHFPDVDRVGHTCGWLSPNQFSSITFVDGLIGEVVAELEKDGYLSRTLLIVTADHGGHGFRHGDDTPEDRTIPWLAVGPGIPAGVTLTRPIQTYDTAATVLYALNLPIPESWDGQPILEIFHKEMESNAIQ